MPAVVRSDFLSLIIISVDLILELYFIYLVYHLITYPTPHRHKTKTMFYLLSIL